MPAPVKLRDDYDGDRLRQLAKRATDADQTRRLLALAAIYDGASRGEAAKIGDVGRQTVRDWVLAFNAQGPDGLIDGKAPGKAPLLGETERAALAEAIEAGPDPGLRGIVRWRLVDLMAWIEECFGIAISKQALSDTLRAMGYRKLSVRPHHHAGDAEAREAFKKNSR
jgi:transposase